MGLRRYHFDNSTMERVLVWIVKGIIRLPVWFRFSRFVCTFDSIEDIFLGECDASPEAVAALANISDTLAAKALYNPKGVTFLYAEGNDEEWSEFFLMVVRLCAPPSALATTPCKE
jgi:hypothetical protein